MQSQSVQTWVGCSEMIFLARLMPLGERVKTPVLCEESPLRVGLPPAESVVQWKPGTAEDLSIVRIEESTPPLPSVASVHIRDYSGASVACSIKMTPDRTFRKRWAFDLWTNVSPAVENEVEALRTSPEVPTEVKYRIWVQPLEDPPRHQLRRAADRPCPPVLLQEAWTVALEHSACAGEVRAPEVDGFAVRGLEVRAGTSLQSVGALAPAELEYLLYPGTRRLPVPATLTAS
jgi:hypothetical protein